MCVSSAPALFAGTKGYIGTAEHPEHGFIHVIGYQNQAANLHGEANAMILPFPTAEAMGPENVVDLGETYRALLTNMVEACRPEVRYRTLSKGLGGGLLNGGSYAKVFQHGIYHVVLASDPELVPAALEQVPEGKRPRISEELMQWYAAIYPGHAIAVCCFSNVSAAESEPLFWWYKPKGGKDALPFFPAVDAHSGRLPNLFARVQVDHGIVVGYDEHHKDSIANRFKNGLPPRIADFLSPYLRGFYPSGRFENGDFFVKNKTLKRGHSAEAAS